MKYWFLVCFLFVSILGLAQNSSSNTLGTIKIQTDNIENELVSIQQYTAAFNGNLFNESGKDTASLKKLILLVSLPFSKLDSFLSILPPSKDIDKLRLELKQVSPSQRFVTLKIILIRTLVQENHFWRDFGTSLSGVVLALGRFVLFLFKIWPFILIFLAIAYLGKIRIKPKK